MWGDDNKSVFLQGLGAAYEKDGTRANILNVRARRHGNFSLIDRMRGFESRSLDLDREHVSLTESYADKYLDQRAMGGLYNVGLSDVYTDKRLFNAHFGLDTDGIISGDDRVNDASSFAGESAHYQTPFGSLSTAGAFALEQQNSAEAVFMADPRTSSITNPTWTPSQYTPATHVAQRSQTLSNPTSPSIPFAVFSFEPSAGTVYGQNENVSVFEKGSGHTESRKNQETEDQNLASMEDLDKIMNEWKEDASFLDSKNDTEKEKNQGITQQNFFTAGSFAFSAIKPAENNREEQESFLNKYKKQRETRETNHEEDSIKQAIKEMDDPLAEIKKEECFFKNENGECENENSDTEENAKKIKNDKSENVIKSGAEPNVFKTEKKKTIMEMSKEEILEEMRNIENSLSGNKLKDEPLLDYLSELKKEYIRRTMQF